MTNLHSDYLGNPVSRLALAAAPALQALAAEVAMTLQALGLPPPLQLTPEHACDTDLDAAEIVICLAAEDDAAVRALNKHLARLEIPCLFVGVHGAALRLGPWTYYGHTPCWECYRTTLRFFHGEPQLPQDGSVPAARAAAAVVEALLDVLAGQSRLITGAILGADAAHAPVAQVLKDPLCEVCSLWSRQPTEAFYVAQD